MLDAMCTAIMYGIFAALGFLAIAGIVICRDDDIIFGGKSGRCPKISDTAIRMLCRTEVEDEHIQR